MTPPVDYVARNRFTQEGSCNFSVIAPAGVGKTQSIVDRLVALAYAWNGNPKGRVAVVTYTRKAALEMEERVREALQVAGNAGSIFLSHVFFGTIHSLALSLLQEEGLELGLPSKLKLVEDERALWQRFCREGRVGVPLALTGVWDKARSFIDIRSAWALGRTFPSGLTAPNPLGPPPVVNFISLYNWEPERTTLRRGVEASVNTLKAWEVRLQKGEEAFPFPEFTAGGVEFLNAYEIALRPLRDWAAEAWYAYAYEVSEAYRRYRLSRGEITYDDMGPLAEKLFNHPAVCVALEKAGYHIVLDEAQDVDTGQFIFLLRLAGIQFDGLTLESTVNNGRFVMVGDPQQAIYSMRADLPTYLKIHQLLIDAQVAEALVFSVTFRCDEHIVAVVNAVFPRVFEAEATHLRQVAFTPLIARAGAGSGHVFRLQLESGAPKPILSEAAELAKWLKHLTPAALQASDWSQVALLCPRNDWLQTLADAFEEARVPYQLHARGVVWRSVPAFNWLLGLLVSLDSPQDAFEVAGVLRELFGIADDALAHWVQSKEALGRRHSLSLGLLWVEAGEIPQALDLLTTLAVDMSTLSLRQAVGLAVERVNLWERLLEVPAPVGTPHAATLQGLLMEVAEKEAEGLTLSQLIGHWKRRLDESLAVSPAEAGKLQLISCHSAKGLQWEAVILPYFFRPITFRKAYYPRLIKTRGDLPPRLKLDRTHKLPELEATLREEEAAEQERLLYVAMTRARHTLVLVDDSSLFPDTAGSFGAYLRATVGGLNYADWLKVLPFAKGVSYDQETFCRPVSAAESPCALSVAPLFVPGVLDLTLTKKKAPLYPKRMVPSALAHGDNTPVEVLPERIPSIGAAGGPAYGNAWHKMMETLPWRQSIAHWSAHMQASLVHFPDLARAEHEIELFLNSSLAALLSAPGIQISAEIPFLWQKDASVAFEGTIDCIAWDANAQVGWVVDWKTDWRESAQVIAGAYAPQLQVYRNALESLGWGAFRAVIYSTRWGIHL